MATAVVAAVNAVFTSGKYRTLLAIFKGLRNGAVYGAKIRLPHALVMTILFRGGGLSEQAWAIFEATWTHSKNLASFVFSYKALMALMCELESKPKEYHSFLAALIGGYLIFGKYNKVNEQINLYLLSRILYGLAKLGVEKGLHSSAKNRRLSVVCRSSGALCFGSLNIIDIRYSLRYVRP